MDAVDGGRDELAELLRAVAGHDRAALRRLYELQAPRLKGIAWRLAGTETLAEDALHDLFTALPREAARFDARRSPASAWLAMLIRFRALDLKRRAGREPPGAEVPDTIDPASDLLAAAIDAAERRSLRACLAQLAPRPRAAILLAFAGGLTHADIARTQNLPLGTVKSLIRRGLVALRRCMDGEAP